MLGMFVSTMWQISRWRKLTQFAGERITVVPVKYSMSGSQGEERGGPKAIFSTMSRKEKQANKYGEQ